LDTAGGQIPILLAQRPQIHKNRRDLTPDMSGILIALSNRINAGFFWSLPRGKKFMEAITQSENQDLATSLRVIGQDLAELLPLVLNIEVKQDIFIVTGKGLPVPSQANGAGEKIFSKLWRSLIHHDTATALVDWQLKSAPFTRTYSQADLLRSDENHFPERMGIYGLPDIYSLGERLRIVGRLIQAKGGGLVHLSKTLNSVAFQFRTEDGAVYLEEHSADELFRLQRKYYSQRETTNESLSIF
jgi:hypothetical protein